VRHRSRVRYNSSLIQLTSTAGTDRRTDGRTEELAAAAPLMCSEIRVPLISTTHPKAAGAAWRRAIDTLAHAPLGSCMRAGCDCNGNRDTRVGGEGAFVCQHSTTVMNAPHTFLGRVSHPHCNVRIAQQVTSRMMLQSVPIHRCRCSAHRRSSSIGRPFE
jgi:hypothetical protein